jgi:hypothetical protein
MNNVESSMEQAIQDAGFSISDTPPTQDAQPTQEAQPVQQAPVEPQQTTAPEPSAPVEQQPVQQQEVQQEAAPVQQDVQNVQDYVQPSVQQEQSSLQDETQSGLEDFFQALSEVAEGPTEQSTETDTITAQDVDPRIQVIADFVAKTGRSPEDWFRYQSLDPSEMDDRTAMRVHMASEYPSLGNDEIDLLINSKYRTDDSIYSDEEVRLANLQLKIDAEKARQSIGELRNDYTTPIVQSSTQAEEEPNPFDDTWMQSNSRSLGELGEIAFDLPNGRSFNFGVSQDYRNDLAQSNSDMTSFFDRYVDNQGEWDHDLWNMHRTVTDNLPNILQSIYQQGLSDGQRTIVERAANIDPQSPQSNTQPSQQDSITQQVLDALGRPQMFLK